MSAGSRRLAAGALVLLPLLGLAGCTGSLFQSKAAPVITYLLSANLAPPAATAPVAADLAVLRPRVRAGLESDRIAVLYPDKRLDYYAGARWSGTLEQVVQDLAVDAFRTGARLSNVSADASAFPSGHWLEIEVADFQAEYAGSGTVPTVHVHLLARLGAAGNRRVLGTFDADVTQPAAEDHLTAIVAAYERAVDAALGRVVADASHALAGEP